MKRPECLHIPTLYEGETAPISWGVDEAHINHILERNFNESFSQALTGYTWENIDNTHESWSKYDQDAMTWTQIETRTGKGRTWERLDYEGLSWTQVENKSKTWQQLESQDISFEIFRGRGVERPGIEQGRTWIELDGVAGSWNNFESFGHTWTESEIVTYPGLSWDGIYARWLTFDEWERKGLTFQELDTQKSMDNHRGMTDTIPIGAKSAVYRIKAYDTEGKETDYLTTSQLPVIPIFYRSSIVEYPVKAGRRYRILLAAQDVYGLDRVRMNLRYNEYLLELNNFAAYGTSRIVSAGDYLEVALKLYSVVPGKIWFQSTRSLTQNEGYSGPIALAEFIAKETGIATVSLS